MDVFDYIFFRTYKFYLRQGSQIADTFASGLVTVLQCFAIIDIRVIIKIFRDYAFPGKLTFVILFVIIGGFNWYRYEHDFDIKELDIRWGEEDNSKRVRNGWILCFSLIIELLIPALYGYFHVNLKVL